MARVSYRSADINLMARMMRAEAEGEGRLGMLYVGNVIVNRLAANCIDFKNLRTVSQVIYQRARGVEKRLAKQNLDYWRQHPAKFALWYFNPHAPCPPTWYGQPASGQFKNHCYYEPKPDTCASVYRG